MHGGFFPASHGEFWGDVNRKVTSRQLTYRRPGKLWVDGFPFPFGGGIRDRFPVLFERLLVWHFNATYSIYIRQDSLDFGWVSVSAVLKFILKEVFQQPLWDCPDLAICFLPCFFSNPLGSSEFPLHIFAACCYTTPTQKYDETYGVEFLNSWYINHVPFCLRELLNMLVRLMEEILNHLGCMKPCK